MSWGPRRQHKRTRVSIPPLAGRAGAGLPWGWYRLQLYRLQPMPINESAPPTTWGEHVKQELKHMFNFKSRPKGGQSGLSFRSANKDLETERSYKCFRKRETCRIFGIPLCAWRRLYEPMAARHGQLVTVVTARVMALLINMGGTVVKGLGP